MPRLRENMPRLRAASVVLFFASIQVVLFRSTVGGFLHPRPGVKIEVDTSDPGRVRGRESKELGTDSQERRNGFRFGRKVYGALGNMLQVSSSTILGTRTPDTANSCCADLLLEEGYVPRWPDGTVRYPDSWSEATTSSSCGDLFLEEGYDPRLQDGTVQYPESCTQGGQGCKLFGVEAPPQSPAPSNTTATPEAYDTPPQERNDTETEAQKPHAAQTPSGMSGTTVMNTSSAQQVPLKNGFGASEYGDSRGDSGGPIVTKDEEVEIGDALSAGSASLLPDLEQDSIRFADSHGWRGYVRPHFAGGHNATSESEREDDPWLGYEELLLPPSVHKVFYEFTVEAETTSTALVLFSNPRMDTKEITFSLVAIPTCWILTFKLTQRYYSMYVQATTRDAPPTALEVLPVARPVVDLFRNEQETQLSYLFVEMPDAGWFFFATNDPAMAHQIGVLPVVPPTIALAPPSGSRTGEATQSSYPLVVVSEAGYVWFAANRKATNTRRAVLRVAPPTKVFAFAIGKAVRTETQLSYLFVEMPDAGWFFFATNDPSMAHQIGVLPVVAPTIALAPPSGSRTGEATQSSYPLVVVSEAGYVWFAANRKATNTRRAVLRVAPPTKVFAFAIGNGVRTETQLSYLFVEMPDAGWFFFATNDPAMAHQIGVLPVVPPTIALAPPSGSRTGEATQSSYPLVVVSEAGYVWFAANRKATNTRRAVLRVAPPTKVFAFAIGNGVRTETQLSYLFVEMPNAGWFFFATNDPAMAHQIGVLPVVPPTIALAPPSGSRTGEATQSSYPLVVVSEAGYVWFAANRKATNTRRAVLRVAPPTKVFAFAIGKGVRTETQLSYLFVEMPDAGWFFFATNDPAMAHQIGVLPVVAPTIALAPPSGSRTGEATQSSYPLVVVSEAGYVWFAANRKATNTRRAVLRVAPPTKVFAFAIGNGVRTVLLVNQPADFVIQLPDEGCVVFADKYCATKRKVVGILVGSPVRLPQTRRGRYPPESSSIVANTASGLAQKNHFVFGFGGRVRQVGYTSGFVIQAGVYVSTAAKDHATQRNIVRIVVGPPERFPETQRGRYPPESTRVAAGISGELHKTIHLSFDYGGVVEQADYTSGFVLKEDVHVVDAAKDHAANRDVAVLLVVPSAVVLTAQRGGHSTESTSVTAGIPRDLDQPSRFLFGFDGGVQQISLVTKTTDFAFASPGEGCVAFAVNQYATKRKIVVIMMGPPVRCPQTQGGRYLSESSYFVPCTSGGLVPNNHFVVGSGGRIEQAKHTTGFAIERDAYIVAAAWDRAATRKTAILPLVPPAVVINTQRGRHSSESTGVAAGIFGVRDHPRILSSDFGVGVEKENDCTTWWYGHRSDCGWEFFPQSETNSNILDGIVELPASCVLEGAGCQPYGVMGEPALILADGETGVCTDDDDPSWFRPGWCWRWFMVVVWGYSAYVMAGFVYCAGLPLKYGDLGYREDETMLYHRRFLAGVILYMADGGAPLFWGFLEIWTIHHIFDLGWDTWEIYIWLSSLLLFTCWTMRPLQHTIPTKGSTKHYVFELLKEYFGLEVVSEFRHEPGKQYLVGQLPHGVMPFGAMLGFSVLDELLAGVWPVSGVVATALIWTPFLRQAINWLGAREASMLSIFQMFADGFQAVTVVTGGIAEMFVSAETEVLTRLRYNFARTALTGGYSIVPIFAFGVSRTLTVCPGFDNDRTRAMSRKLKLPVLLYKGAWGLVPHRQQIKLVSGRAIHVEKAEGPVSDEECAALCKKVQTAVLELYDTHKPFWEEREAEFVP